VQLEAITAAAAAGLNDHDRWLNKPAHPAHPQARRPPRHLKTAGAATRPIVSAGMIAEELGITPRAAQDLVAALGLREATGRRRYRAWGIP
jgi:HTH DNA binding domain